MAEIEAKDNAWLRLNSQYPGGAIADACIGLDAAQHGGAANVTAAARLGVDRKTLSRFIYSHCAISPDMAVRLESVGWRSAGWTLVRAMPEADDRNLPCVMRSDRFREFHPA